MIRAMPKEPRADYIPCQNKDSFLKFLLDTHLSLLLKIMGLASKFNIVATETNDLSPIEGIQFRADRLYRLLGGSYLNIELDSTGDPGNLLRYGGVYSSLLRMKVYCRDKRYCAVYSVVIYTYGVTLPPAVAATEGDNRFQVTQVSMEDVVDGDKVLADLQAKVKLGCKLFDSDEDILKAPLAIHGRVRGNHAELCRRLFALISPPVAADKRNSVAIALIATASKHILGDSELQDLVEATMSKHTIIDEMDEWAGGYYAKQTRDFNQLKREYAQLKGASERSQAEVEKYRRELAEANRKLALATASKGNGEPEASPDGGGL
jgi:hypothetical protein